MSLEISLASFVFHVSVYDKDLDPMITLKKRFKTPVRKIFPRFIVCRRLRTQGRCHKLLRLCWPLHMGSCCAHRRVSEENGHILGKKTHKAGKIASIRGKKSHVYRVIILKQMLSLLLLWSVECDNISSYL